MIEEGSYDKFLDSSNKIENPLEINSDETLGENGDEILERERIKRENLESSERMLQGEREIEGRQEKKEILGVKALNNYVGEISSKIRETSSFPVKGDGSIDMKPFSKRKFFSQEEICSVIKKGERLKKKEAFINRKRKIEIIEQFGKGIGNNEQKKIIKYRKKKEATFQKFFMAMTDKIIGDNFYICRASKYDDLVSGIDILIMNRKTEGIICGIDLMRIIVFEKGKKHFLKKKKDVLEISLLFGGGELSFFSLKQRKEKNIPIFCIPFRDGYIKKNIDNFNAGLSKNEIKFFDIFLAEIKKQILTFKNYSSAFPNLLKERLDTLENDVLGKMEEMKKEKTREQGGKL